MSFFLAGTWINLQDAYVVEGGTLGTWVAIGYSAPGERSDGSSFKSKEFVYKEDAAGKWAAGNINKLDACAAEAAGAATHWQLEAKVGTGSQKGTMSVEYPSGFSANDCVALTPAFKTLTRVTQ